MWTRRIAVLRLQIEPFLHEIILNKNMDVVKDWPKWD